MQNLFERNRDRRATPTSVVGAFALLFFAGPLDLAAQNPPVLSAQKLTDFHKIYRRFTNGTVNVIVTLASPASPTATDFRSPSRMAGLRPQLRKAQQDVLDTLPSAHLKVGFRFDNIAGFSAKVTTNGLQALQAHPGVLTIEPVMELVPHLAQGIPLIHGMTYRSTYNGAGLAIAICDTGIDYTHARLGGGGFPNSKVLGGYDFGDSDANPIPNSEAHGTCCAGIAAGDLGTVGDYIGGVAYSSKLYALKISASTTGSASTAAMVAAWDWCVTHQNDDPIHPIMVISTSFGGGQYYSTCDSITPSMTTAANNAVAAGITVLASSGNDGYCDSLAWPSCISSVISVGAVYDATFGNFTPCVSAASCAPKIATTGCTTGWYVNDPTAGDRVTAYANVASFLTVLAPGNDCSTLDIVGASGYSSDDYFANFGGTSAACPYAAGAVACLQSAAKALLGNYLTPAEVRNRLVNYGNNVTDTKVAITKPRVNFEQLIQSLQPQPLLNLVATNFSGGNGNQSVDPNECNYLSVTVRNDGNLTASNIVATLTSSTTGVIVVQANSVYPDLAPAASATNVTAFKISTSPAFVCGTPVNLPLVLNYSVGSRSNSFSLASGSANYVLTQSAGAAIVPGTTDIGNHDDDANTTIALPFAYSFYGQPFTSASVSGNGIVQFTGVNSDFANVCLPASTFNNAIFAFWDDLRTDGTVNSPQGIFTSISGISPNRTFNIEWRASYYSATSNGSPVNFEVRLYEGQPRFDIIYGTLNGNGNTVTVGAQKDTGSVTTQFSCNAATLSAGLQLTYQPTCADGGGACDYTSANFTGSPVSGLVPLTVAFTNFSIGATNFDWNFGNGITSSVTNPVVTYTNLGSYTVSLTAVGTGGTNTLTRSNYIVVTNPPPTVANFTATPTNGGAPLAVTFVNSSANATNYSWDFGDGKISSAANPANTYTNAGSYSVRLTAVGLAGTNQLTRTNYIVITNAVPSITTQPQNQNVNLGSNATFTINAIGTPPLGYQWRFNGTIIAGATTSAYTRTNAQTADIGTYSVVVSNVAGSVTSSNANLMVVVSPGVISVTGIPYNENFNSMGASGTAPTPFGWYVGTGTAAISSTTATAGTGSSGTARNYNFGSSGASDRALGSLASASTQRDTEARFINVSGLWISALTIGYNGEQWRVGGNNGVNNQLVLQYSTDGTNFTALGAAFNFNTPTDSSSASSLDGNASANRVTGIGGTFTPANNITNGQRFYLRWADADDTGSDHGIAVDDLVVTFTLTNPAPVITVPPQSQSVTLGSNVTFTVTATGTPPLAYQWLFNSTNVASATTTTLALTNVQTTNAGIYSVVVTNGGGATTSAIATLTVNLPPLANFAGNPTNGFAPLIVAFTNLSANATGFVWNFGDGNTKTNANPLNTYSNAGTYTVTLTATGAGGTNVLTRTNYIVVTNLPPLANFSGNSTSGFAPLIVAFTNLSANATGFTWNFGNGNTSTNVNPLNTYSNAGSFTVTLAAIGAGGTNTLTFTNYIIVTNLPPLANFSGSPTNGFAPLIVAFTNLSANATSFVWNFGDGNTKTNANPLNTYSNAGTYTVTLAATGLGGTSVLAHANYIVVTNLPPLASFTGNPTNGLAPLAVTFTNLSVNATGFAWDFGDGNTSTNANPLNTYSNAGNFTVILTAIGVGGTNVLTRTNYIVVSNFPPPLADFAADITNGLPPLTVVFTNLSLNATDFTWNFGDGNTSTNANPPNTYSNAGSFTVTLAASDAGGTNTLTLTNYIVVTNFPPPLADFAAETTNGLAALTVAFTNLSANATDFAWDFGDGNTSTNVNPFNTYSNAGSFTVTLTAVGAGGTNTLTLSNYIVVTNYPPPATGTIYGQVQLQGFTGTGPRTVQFVASDSGEVGLQTNDVSLNFAGSPNLADYTLTVPTNTAYVSAKTAWNLRRRQAVIFTDGVATNNLTGTAGQLLGGDISQNNNLVNTADYTVLKGNWLKNTEGADLTGDGLVNTADYTILKGNWLKAGDPP